MKVIDKAFKQAIDKTPCINPKKGWWGCYFDNQYFIMRYEHVMVYFDKQNIKIHTQQTRTDLSGNNNAVQLIKDWQSRESQTPVLSAETKPVKRLKILGILQNLYNPVLAKRGAEIQNPYILTDSWNLQNATYARIKKIWYNNVNHDCYLTECTPKFLTTHTEKTSTDHAHLKSHLEFKEWNLIFVFGKQAEEAISEYPHLKDRVHLFPHPISFQWRKTLIDDMEKIILSKL
jgi:hypothetical protein